MSHFLAHLWKMKHIRRWGLMRNVEPENLHEHSWQVAVVAHLLSSLRNERFGGQVDPNAVSVLALFHEVGEAVVGDLPTPIKYYNDAIRDAFARIEQQAKERLLASLPADLEKPYRHLVLQNGQHTPELELVKAADRICAYLKCRQELKFGNADFEHAEHAVLERLRSMNLPEVDCFLEEFLPSFELTIDELNKPSE